MDTSEQTMEKQEESIRRIKAKSLSKLTKNGEGKENGSKYLKE